MRRAKPKTLNHNFYAGRAGARLRSIALTYDPPPQRSHQPTPLKHMLQIIFTLQLEASQNLNKDEWSPSEPEDIKRRPLPASVRRPRL